MTDPDAGQTRIKLPSGAKKVVKSTVRGMVGIVAGGGRTDKPLMSMISRKHSSYQRVLILITEASRAKHKFAVKRNSWPKTRGVAKNPVDHVRQTLHLYQNVKIHANDVLYSPTEVVITSISVRPRRCRATLRKDRRQVSSLRGERVCYVVRRRRRIRGSKAVVFSRLACSRLPKVGGLMPYSVT